MSDPKHRRRTDDVVWEELGSRFLGIRDLRSFADEVREELVGTRFGYDRLQPHADSLGRRLVGGALSGHLFQALGTLSQRLFSIQLHLKTVEEVYPSIITGVYQGRTVDQRHLQQTRGDQALAGALSEMCGLLDCYASITAIVLGLSTPPIRIHWSSIERVDDRAKLLHQPSPSAMLDARRGYFEALDIALAHPPGWCTWLFDMRNSLVHRPSGIKLHGPAPASSPTVLFQGPGAAEMNMEQQRFIFSLPRRPGLPEALDMACAGGIDQIRLWEPAILTLNTVFDCLVGLLISTSTHLHLAWDATADEWTSDSFLPWKKWDATWKVDQLSRQYDGVGQGYPPNAGNELVVSPEGAQYAHLFVTLSNFVQENRAALGITGG